MAGHFFKSTDYHTGLSPAVIAPVWACRRQRPHNLRWSAAPTCNPRAIPHPTKLIMTKAWRCPSMKTT